MRSCHITFIAPLFSRGAYEDRAEIRAPSIRGQLHWWFRALGGSYEEEKRVFGGVHNGATASKVVVRVVPEPFESMWKATLPHKPSGASERNGPNAPRCCLDAGSRFELQLLARHGGLGNMQAKFDSALEAWLLMGGLGLRSTRAAGSFRFEHVSDGAFSYPESFEEYTRRCGELLKGTSIRMAILEKEYRDADTPLRMAADMIGGPRGTSDWSSLEMLNWPLGNVRVREQDSVCRIVPKRKTSPLRFRVIQVGKVFRMAVIWDGRYPVTGNRPGDLEGVIRLLAERKPDVGKELMRSPLYVDAK